MADFYEVVTAHGYKIIVNMDAVERIVPHKDGSKIIFQPVISDTIVSTEKPSDILRGLETYNEEKAVAIWRRTNGKDA